MTQYLQISAADILQKRKRYRRELLQRPGLQDIKIAVLGGSTTSEVVDFLEFYLLCHGFRPAFYQSEYGRFYEEATLEPEKIKAFGPDFLYIHTHYLNAGKLPSAGMSLAAIDDLLAGEMWRFKEMWSTLQKEVGCQIIQNNFEHKPLNAFGNLDSVIPTGHNHYLQELNREFARCAASDASLTINDIQFEAASLGLTNWFDWNRWFSYKIVTTPEGSAAIGKSVAALINAIRGRAKKCLVLDLDNTLWGGVIGDDGPEHIHIGRETAMAEAHTALQQYCLSLRERGILLAVCSKNDEEVAKSGFKHPDSVLKLEHFSAFKANWNPKHESIEAIANELSLGLDSFVFLDDNPAERAIVAAQLPSVEVPDVGTDVALFPSILQGLHYFEAVSLSKEDLQRAEKYSENAARVTQQAKFANYGEYLKSLAMTAEINAFQPVYLDRITQLINKSNQFNLTTRRYTYPEIQRISESADYVHIYGRLRDTFGDNGLVSVIIGRLEDATLSIELWIMSCRVLKRDMEVAMLDALVERAKTAGARELVGRYIRSERNGMVADHYERLGFQRTSPPDSEKESTWFLNPETYVPRNQHIAMELSLETLVP